MQNEPLGTEYEAAVQRAETVLLPAFDSWRSGGSTDAQVADVARPGTLDWVFAEYRTDRRFTKLDARTRRNHEVGFRLVGGYVMKDGRRLGTVSLAAVTTAVTDALYEKLLVASDGRERRTTVNHAMKTCRRAWNVAARRNPGKVPARQPVRAMGLNHPTARRRPRRYAELQAFRAKAIEMGHPSLATAALIGMGMAATRARHLRHVRRDALSAERTAQCGARAYTKRPERRIGFRCSMTWRAALPRTDVRTRCDQARAHRRFDVAARLGRARAHGRPGRRRTRSTSPT